MFFFTETLNVSRPVMDCLDQIQRADGMASEGRKVFFPVYEPWERRVILNVRAKSFSATARGHCHTAIVTLMGPVSWCLWGCWQLVVMLGPVAGRSRSAGLGWRTWKPPQQADGSVSPRFLPIRRLMTA